MKDSTAVDNTYTRGIAHYVSNVRLEDVPGDVKERLKLVILDSLGCGIYAADLEWSRILIDGLADVDSTTACGVWGSTVRLSAPHAALVNGTLIQGYEIDDVFLRGPIHVGAVVLPALCAVAEMWPKMTGREFLRAALAGYEIAPRASLCMGPEHLTAGWHSGATTGVFGAAAAAAAGLGLNEEQTIHALGIAGTQASGLMAAQYGAMVKRMHAGRAAQSGLYGALLAARGFTGIIDVFESKYGGFCTAFTQSADKFNLKELTWKLGEHYYTRELFLKFYSCVGGVHPTLDAIRELREKRNFRADEVEQVKVGVSETSIHHSGWKYRPEGVTSAQLNMAYCLATMILEGECFVDQFSEDLVADPARLALIERIDIQHDPAITALGRPYRHKVTVEVRLKDGTVLSTTIQKRFEDMPFPPTERVLKKFDILARHAFPQSQVDAIRDAVLGLEKLDDAKNLTRLLSKR
jgi:2-methylcitrate dehydratase PrpD